jgi:tetratricopeptide (TPR) repeat protein
MTRHHLFIPVICSIVLLVSVSGFAVEETAAPSPEIAKLLKEVEWKRRQALKDRFNPMLHNLSTGDYRQLYLDAVYAVFFANQPNPQKDFQNWAKTNKGLVADPRLPLAANLAALNLQGHLHLIMGEEETAVNCFVKVLQGIASGPDNLCGFHLLQESLGETLFVKYFAIENDYLNKDGSYTGAIGNVEAFFTANILPWYREQRSKEVAAIWDTAITASAKTATLSEEKHRKFQLTDHPRLLSQKAGDLYQLGYKKEALNILKETMQKFPEYPDFEDLTKQLINYAR